MRHRIFSSPFIKPTRLREKQEEKPNSSQNALEAESADFEAQNRSTSTTGSIVRRYPSIALILFQSFDFAD
jgi:hypothetical protein